MIKALKKYIVGIIIMSLLGCTPVILPSINRYQLTETSTVKKIKNIHSVSLLIMQPVALDGYDTEQMLYINRPYQIAEFANNMWMSPPATMLLPILMHSIESSHYFYAVTSDLNISQTDYRLESVLIRLQQNFLTKPSQIQFVLQVTLIRNSDNGLVATNIISESLSCPNDSPLGGVIAANQISRHISSRVAHFVIAQVKRDQKNQTR